MFRVDRARGPVWFAKYRLPDGRQVQRKIGPARTGRGRPAAGSFTKRTAEDWLREVLDAARRRTLPGMVRTGATFADAAAEWLRSCEIDRGCKPSTLVDYRSNLNAHLLPGFGDRPGEDITSAEIERWRSGLTGLASRSRSKLLVVMHGVLGRAQKVWGLPGNAVDGVEKQRQRSTVDFPGLLIRVRASFSRAGDLAEVGQGPLDFRWLPKSPEFWPNSATGTTGTGDDDLVFVGEHGLSSTAPPFGAATPRPSSVPAYGH